MKNPDIGKNFQSIQCNNNWTEFITLQPNRRAKRGAYRAKRKGKPGAYIPIRGHTCNNRPVVRIFSALNILEHGDRTKDPVRAVWDIMATTYQRKFLHNHRRYLATKMPGIEPTTFSRESRTRTTVPHHCLHTQKNTNWVLLKAELVLKRITYLVSLSM